MKQADITAKYESGLALHRAGQLAPALKVYLEILAIQPSNFDVLHMAGVAHFQLGNAKAGAAHLVRALAVHPNHAAAQNNYAAMLERLGRMSEADESYSRAIELFPGYTEAFSNRGNVRSHLRQFENALSDFDAALALKPDHTEAWNGRGNALRALGRYPEALASYDHALALQPNNPAFHNNRGIVLAQMGRPLDALASYDAAIAGKSDSAIAYYNRGNALLQLEQFDNALTSFDRASALGLNHAQLHNNRGNALRGAKRLDDAIASYDAALAREPEYIDALQNRAAVLGDLGRHKEALAIYDDVLAKQPSTELLNSKAISQSEVGLWDEAIQSHEAALALQPHDAETLWALSMCRLRRGDFTKGWQGYEARWRAASSKLTPRDFTQPLWQGHEPIDGKTILLHAEQGLGDTLQFSRYVPMLAARGAKIVLEVQAPLRDLLADLQGVTHIVARGEELPHFDLHSPLMSLPRALGTDASNIPGASGYLQARADQRAHWKAKLAAHKQPRIGFVWGGNPKHKNDHRRSLALQALLGALPQTATLVSLQKDVSSRDQHELQRYPNIIPAGADLHDFTDTAALCAELDLIVSVDTSVAHLAGALGKPTWILLPFNPDWRWLLDRQDSPWYDAARLYRQSAPDDWTETLQHLKTDLASFRAS